MDQSTVSRIMQEMGRKGGKAGGSKGGKARAQKLTPQERSAQAKKAAAARWAKSNTDDKHLVA